MQILKLYTETTKYQLRKLKKAQRMESPSMLMKGKTSVGKVSKIRRKCLDSLQSLKKKKNSLAFFI